VSAKAVAFSLVTFALTAGLLAGHPRAAPATPAAAACGEKKFLPARISCFLEAAKSAEDAAVCERAQDPVVRFQCLSLYAEHNRDPAACARIEARDMQGQALRDSCVAGVAFLREEPGLCAGLTLPEVRDACYVKLVLEAGADGALCGRIENAVLKQVCIEDTQGRD
jgi:hypothetical protein